MPTLVLHVVRALAVVVLFLVCLVGTCFGAFTAMYLATRGWPFADMEPSALEIVAGGLSTFGVASLASFSLLDMAARIDTGKAINYHLFECYRNNRLDDWVTGVIALLWVIGLLIPLSQLLIQAGMLYDAGNIGGAWLWIFGAFALIILFARTITPVVIEYRASLRWAGDV